MVYMSVPKQIMASKPIDFIGRPTMMGKKMIIIIPTEFHKDFEKHLGKLMKFRGDDVLDK